MSHLFNDVRRTWRRLKGKSTPPICLVNLPRSLHDLHIPLGLLSLASSLEEASHEVHLVDFDFMLKSGGMECDDSFFTKAVQVVEETRATIFGITADCANFPIAVTFARQLRESNPRATIILGGPQASFVPVETLEVFPEIDFIVVGEGETTLPELLDVLRYEQEPRAVKGIAYVENGRVVVTPPRELIADLDAIPTPSFRVFPVSHYIRLSKITRDNVFLPVEAGRGCPNACYYCATSRMWRRHIRNKSPVRIYEEMSLLKERHDISAFELIHDNLSANNRFLNEFCQFLVRIGSPFSWSCSAGTEGLSRELLCRMKEAGCTNIFLGIESGSRRMQNIMGKRLDIESADAIIEICADLDLDVTTAFILGFPEETEGELDTTLRKALDYKQLGARLLLSRLSPLSGTPVHENNIRRMELKDDPSNVSPHIFSFSGQRDIIQRYPKIFSSFYSLPNIHYPDLDLKKTITFYDVATSYFSPALVNVLEAIEAVQENTLDLFRHWEQWRTDHHPGKEITADFVFYSFNEFLDFYSRNFYSRLDMAKTCGSLRA